jgi:hypothetical protein
MYTRDKSIQNGEPNCGYSKNYKHVQNGEPNCGCS